MKTLDSFLCISSPFPLILVHNAVQLQDTYPLNKHAFRYNLFSHHFILGICTYRDSDIYSTFQLAVYSKAPSLLFYPASRSTTPNLILSVPERLYPCLPLLIL